MGGPGAAQRVDRGVLPARGGEKVSDADAVRAQLEYLSRRYASQRMLARALGVSQGLVSLILAGKRGVTDDIAAKVEKVYIDAL